MKLWNNGVRVQTHSWIGLNIFYSEEKDWARHPLRPSIHSWIQSFLTNKQQRVAVNSESLDWVHVNSVMSQGTVLGPVLFLSFINDLVKSAKYSEVDYSPMAVFCTGM